MKRAAPSFFLTFVLAILLPVVAGAQHPTFAIVSDSHVGYPNSAYEDFMEAIDNENVKMIIHTGDAIDSPGNVGQWKRFLEITGPGKVLHLAPGNHDIQGEASLKVFLGFFPKPYYSFSEGDTLFVLLCTELPGEESSVAGGQFDWAAKELARPFSHKFVFLHEPLFPVVRGHGLDRHPEARDRLHKLFVKTRVSLVVAGHDHIYDRGTKDGILYVIAGRTGGWPFPEALSNGGSLCYAIATGAKDGYAFVVKDTDGEVKDTFFVGRHRGRPSARPAERRASPRSAE